MHRWVAANIYLITPFKPATEEPAREEKKEKLKQSWQTKTLHGRFFVSLHQQDVDVVVSNTYITSGYIFPQTEETFFAIQNQVEPTRTYIRHIMHQPIDSTKCRLCNDGEESVQQLSSGCSAIAGTEYPQKHTYMRKVVHQLLCIKRQLLQHFTPHHKYIPETEKENETTKI